MADLRDGAPLPHGRIFFNFMHFFWKIWLNRILAPPPPGRSVPAPMGSPGSAPVTDLYILIFKKYCRMAVILKDFAQSQQHIFQNFFNLHKIHQHLSHPVRPLKKSIPTDNSTVLQHYFYRQQRSCGKVMFLHLCVVQLTGGGLCLGGSLSGGVSVRGSLSRGVSFQGVTSGRYASYWNAFLLDKYICYQKIKSKSVLIRSFKPKSFLIQSSILDSNYTAQISLYFHLF